MSDSQTSPRPFHLLWFPLLFVVNHFFAIVTPDRDHYDPIAPWLFNFLGAVGVCFGLTFLGYKIGSRFVSPVKSALLATLICLPFFFFQDAFLSADQYFLPGIRARWGLSGLLLGILILCGWIIRSKRTFSALANYLNAVSLALALYTTGALIFSFSERMPKVLRQEPSKLAVNCTTCPDIYFLLLDSYTSNQSLRDYFQFDNREFVNGLQGMSFAVADDSKSGYTLTPYSLTATLNLNVFGDLKPYKPGLAEALNRNAVTESLSEAGYTISNYSIFNIHQQPPYYSIAPYFPVKFIKGILENSVINMLYAFTLKASLYETHMDILAKVDESISHSGPDFVYAHILAPHPPFVMDEQGNEISYFDQTKDPQGYIRQIKGLNIKVTRLVKHIREASPDAVIIIMGDHGYRYLQGPAAKEEALSTFLAYHGPNQDKLDSLASSNDVFRLVMEIRVKN